MIIKFAYPDYGSTLIRESALILKDRAITAGDVVKRKSSDAGSGMVIKTSMTCFLQPIYNDLPYHGSESWSHLPQNNRILVPGEDLDTLDYEVGDRIIYRDWMGEIADIFQEVSVRLSNGTVVKVQDPALLEVPNYVFKPVNPSNELPIADALSMGRSRRNAITSVKPNEKGNTSPPSYLYPGQTVLTTKANLRLGRWVIGSYTASEPPRGIVVNINVTSVRVDWIATKPSNIGRPDFSKPDEIIDFPDIEEIRLYDRHNLTSATDSTSNSFGSRHGHNFSAGDVVKFRDIAGAAVKYSEHSPARAVQGVFRRIPRMITQGFDMNTFQIIETNTCAFIQWQDGSVTKENSNDVIPYVNVDDHDVWVGEIVSLKNAEEKRDGFIYLKEVGVVQSVDALERIAKVRWFEEPEAVVVDGIESELFPSTLLGPISDRESSVALFDIMAYPALTRRRGDLVVLRPASVALQGRLALERALALHHANLSDTPASADMFPSMAASRPSLASYPLADFPNSFFAPRNEDSQNILSNSEVRWFGEVVDLGLDGLLAVRLGGLDKPEDIRVPVERVTVVLGGEFDSESDDSYDSSDDYSGMSEDESYISDDDSWLYRLQEGFDGFDGSPMAGPFTSHDEFAGRLVREHLETEGDQQTDLEVEYEGGERLDSGLEEDWMTDDTEDSEDEDEKSNNKKTNTKSKADKDVEMQDAPLESESSSSSAEQNGNISHPRPIVHTSKPGNPSALSDPPKQSTPNRSSIPNDKPLQFEILESSEHRNHHFTSSAPTLSAQFLRRVRKEHSMLENCLPEGIWIRTWEERLDLLRVLILGPRGTPYELAPFLFDFKLPFDFPTSPPQVYFHSWTNNIGRINPNLYEDGKVCLSILGTWDSSSTIEGWSPSKSSMLQVLVSILGLVLVEEPYYSESISFLAAYENTYCFFIFCK